MLRLVPVVICVSLVRGRLGGYAELGRVLVWVSVRSEGEMRGGAKFDLSRVSWDLDRECVWVCV